MFVTRTKEHPSVASTRVLKTHRMNSVEMFRLQDKVKTIDHETKLNYCQISDEIDGVRQNLVKIKGVKKNVGVSIERRKLLRDKGLRILPSKGDKNHFTVRTSDGRDVNIPCSDFYDGDALRKHLSIDKFQSTGTQLAFECFEEEEGANTPAERKRSSCVDRPKELRYRNISPPLRPGSRRNFKDVDDENSEDNEKLVSLDFLSNNERKYGILRPQTAYINREVLVSQRPRSWACRTSCRKISRKDSGLKWLDERKISRKYPPVIYSSSDENKKHSQENKVPEKRKQETSNNIALSEEIIPREFGVRPKPRAKSFSVASCVSSHIPAISDIRRLSLDFAEESIRLPRTPSSENWCEKQMDESNTPSVNEDTKTDKKSNPDKDTQRAFRKSPNRKVSWKDLDNGKRRFVVLRDKQNEYSLSVSEPVTRPSRSASLSSVSSQRRGASSSHIRPKATRSQVNLSEKSSKTNRQRGGEDFVPYDARSDRALSKGYMTMQMTIGDKQVQVYVPKFSTECFDVVERARTKSAAKAAGLVGRPRPFLPGKNRY